MRYDFTALGIHPHRSHGQEKLRCPFCQSDRSNPSDKSLSINHDTGGYTCHYPQCGSQGYAKDMNKPERHFQKPAKKYVRPAYEPSVESPEEKFFKWFADRGIPAEVVKRNRIEPRQFNGQRHIAFPFFRDGQVVNVQYRSHDKQFKMESGAELCLYGLDDIEEDTDLIFCEGQMDKLALETAGFTNCVSVPNGAGTNLDILAHDQNRLERVKRIIWAGDNDEAGKKLEREAIRRLGPERCARVEWPFGCKDANQVLVDHGIAKLVECVRDARPVPIEGAFEINDIRQDIIDLYENGRPKGVSPGWTNLAEFYRPRLGDWTVIIGIPSSGKSAFLAALLVNLALAHQWVFAVYPPENLPPQEYASVLMELYIGKPFDVGPTLRMTESERDTAMDWVHEHFVILNPLDDERHLDGLLSIGKSYVLRRGIQGFAIDPWNELEHLVPDGQTMTQYIGHSLIKIRNFARVNRLHCWITAHPKKLVKNKDGNYDVPTLYDTADSSHWYNKPDMGIAIHRDKTDDTKPVEIYIQKVRFRWCGKVGVSELYYDRVTGRYSEATPQATSPRYWTDERERIEF